ncbi:MAG: helix-turn-helix transcriptional regulator [Clostridia bacterium]|nr:helix-turn-helix transcriptional regulator [Clostridia bacterium]
MNINYYRHNKNVLKVLAIENSRINFNELTFAIKGELIYTINNATVTVKAGDAVFLPEGSVRHRSSTNAADYVSFNFTGSAPNLPTHLENCLTGEIKLLITLCDEIYAKYSEWKSKISDATSLILKLLNEKLSSREENPVVLEIKRYIQSHLSKKLCLKDIADKVGYSPNYCDTLFRTHAGTSILNHVIERRIAEAKLLLTEGALSLTEIAEAVGFEDYNYFSRTFKKKSGYTPTEFKSNTQSRI